MALVHNDLRRLIAYLSISQIGYMVLAAGVGITTINTPAFSDFGSMAFTGSLFHMINDAIYKALLFLSIITITYVTDKRDINEISGIAKKLPYTTFFFVIGALSVAGIPPLSGFYSKLIIYKSTFSYHPLIGLFAVTNTIIILVVIIRVLTMVFLDGREDQTREKIPRSMFLGMTILACIVIIFSIFPHVIVSRIINPSVDALVESFQTILL